MSKEILNPILTEFDKLSDDALLTLRDVINMPARSRMCPATRGLLPISRAAWYVGIKAGKYPKPIKLGSGNYWRAGDIRRLINGQSVEGQA